MTCSKYVCPQQARPILPNSGPSVQRRVAASYHRNRTEFEPDHCTCAVPIWSSRLHGPHNVCAPRGKQTPSYRARLSGQITGDCFNFDKSPFVKVGECGESSSALWEAGIIWK